jgi:hypothetical protein
MTSVTPVAILMNKSHERRKYTKQERKKERKKYPTTYSPFRLRQTKVENAISYLRKRERERE